MTAAGRSVEVPPPLEPADRPIAGRLARLHLRTGAFGLARAELETIAGAGELDDEALLDLAEVRWRTGDLAGAGEAARAYLATGREDALGFVIAAEAAALLGRPGEARRLATRALERTDVPLDSLFAGIHRSAIWPTDPTDPGEPAGALFPPAEASAGRRLGSGASLGSTAVARAASSASAPVASAVGPAMLGPGLWDDVPPDELSGGMTADPREELSQARKSLEVGDADTATVHLGLALRLDPSVALAVLEIAGTHAGAGLDLVRGDAYRLIGHETEARHSYASAARSGSRAARSPDDPGSTKEVT